MKKASLFLSLFAFSACHHATETGVAPEATPSNAGTIGTFQPFPAVLPDSPQVVSIGGPVMDTPTVVAITFPNDPLADDVEAFTSTLGATDYWKQATSEYGVAPLKALTPIRMTEDAPATTSDAEIQQWLRDKLDGTHPEFPPPSVNIVYALYYPISTVIDDGGSKSCQAYGGYHNSTSVLTTGDPVVYAVLPRCSFPPLTQIQTLTVAGSHEFVEAATDPQPLDNPAFLQVDDNHAIYARFNGGGGEVGDMCESYADANYKPADYPYMVQRIWSNAAAASGHSPCVPSADATYFNSVPVTPRDTIPMITFMGPVDTAGWVIPVGESKDIQFEIFSTAPMQAPIALSAVDLTSRNGKPGTLSFKFAGTTSGPNGTFVNVTISALGASSSRSGVSSFEILASSGTEAHSWIGVIQAQ